MFDRDEAARSLEGAWRLFLDRPDAMRFFDVSVDGFWRSFGAIVLVAPAYAVTGLAERAATLADAVPEGDAVGGAFLFARLVTLALDWVCLPIVLALIAGPLGVSRNYAAFVVARNWCAVLAVAPFGIVSLLYVIGVVDIGIANFLSLAVLVVVLRYNFLVARQALGAGFGLAIGVVALDFCLSLLIVVGVDGLAGL